jgi:hypothetical protein
MILYTHNGVKGFTKETDTNVKCRAVATKGH